jgi:hypothetical protein
MNSYRKFVTSSVGFTFLVVGITGVIFQFFFKNQILLHIHGWLGVAMVVAAAWHIFQNWKPLQNHLRDRRVFLLCVPIIAVMAFLAFGQNEKGRERNMNPRELMGKLTQASATDPAKVFGKDVNTVFARMKGDGLQAEGSTMTVQALAQENHQSPDGILVYFAK